MVPRWQIFDDFLRPVFAASRVQHVSDLLLKLCTMFGRLLGWYICIFGGSCPLTGFCQVQNSLCVQILLSPILAALLHGTRALGVN